jgi:hypothetical protein
MIQGFLKFNFELIIKLFQFQFKLTKKLDRIIQFESI